MDYKLVRNVNWEHSPMDIEGIFLLLDKPFFKGTDIVLLDCTVGHNLQLNKLLECPTWVHFRRARYSSWWWTMIRYRLTCHISDPSPYIWIFTFDIIPIIRNPINKLAFWDGTYHQRYPCLIATFSISLVIFTHPKSWMAVAVQFEQNVQRSSAFKDQSTWLYHTTITICS